MSTARESGKFTRGTASKLYGIANFWGQGIYGRVGYGGLIVMAIKARQGEATTMLTPEIEACVEADNHGSGGFHMFPPHLFPTGRVLDLSQFCGNKLRRAYGN